MRYGAQNHLEIDPAARRAPGQSLKKGAKGAPFGWTTSGEPYIGTQYGVNSNGTTFYSISTRDGGETRYPNALHAVSTRVAQSALETHGSVRGLVGMGEAPLEVGHGPSSVVVKWGTCRSVARSSRAGDTRGRRSILVAVVPHRCCPATLPLVSSLNSADAPLSD